VQSEADRRIGRSGKVKSNRNSQANSKAPATRPAWKAAMNQGLERASKDGNGWVMFMGAAFPN